MKTIRELYLHAMQNNYQSLILLIDFVVLEKKVLTLDDHKDELERYFNPKHRTRMNELLIEYEKKRLASS
jgi:hypothetical protein